MALEDAFAALVQRHGPTVLGVCRRMLLDSHDVEDAFQATFLVLARAPPRSAGASNWETGFMAWRSGRPRRPGAGVRERALETRLMNVSQAESEHPDDRDDLLPLLDEELNRLPENYRSALLACELEGKSRREAAQHLGIPEGTLSARLARGRKLLRERLLRRGVNLGLGPIGGLSRAEFEDVVLERLVEPTVRAAVGGASGAGATTAVRALAKRVLKMMFYGRLTLVVLLLVAASAVPAVVLGLTHKAAQTPKANPAKVGPDDLPGRVVDQAGKGVADVQVWATDGFSWTPKTVARTTTDAEGRFVVPDGQKRALQGRAEGFGLFVRSPDGRVGWLRSAWRNGPDGRSVEVDLSPVGDARGMLIDQSGRPIAGVEVAPLMMSRTNVDGIWLSPEPRALLRTKTAADGSFVLNGIPKGAQIAASIASPVHGTPTVWWDTGQEVTIALDSRLGRIRGRLKPPDGLSVPRELSVGLNNARRPEVSAPAPFELSSHKSAEVDKDGTFQFDALPPGPYAINAYFDKDGMIAIKTQAEVEVRPGAVAEVEIPLQRVPMITGRVIDARTGKGIAGVKLASLLQNPPTNPNLFVAEATTDADGRYKIAARPGTIMIQLAEMPKTHLGTDDGYPRLDVKADFAWPDFKLSPATELDGLVVNEAGQPVAAAEVFILAPERGRVRRPDSIQTKPDGTFHFDQLDADDKLSLWARAGDATSEGEVVVRPKDLKGKVTVAIAPKYAVRIRALVTDDGGKRISGAKVTLWWTRMYPKGARSYGSGAGTVLTTETTGADGWFVLRSLWAGPTYEVIVEARGHNKAETAKLSTKSGEICDAGKLVLVRTAGTLAGRVVDSGGLPIAGAEVFNRGDGPEAVASSTDAQGRFRLDGLLPGIKYVFARKRGHRFTGVKVGADDLAMTITLKETDEPSPAWKPGDGPAHEEQRAFARRLLIRLWDKYVKNANDNSAFFFVKEMAKIDRDLARQWSAEKGHRHDDPVRFAEAGELADTDTMSALALLNQKPDKESQSELQTLADRFAVSDPKKALVFATEAAVQARGLNQPDRTIALARSGAVLVKLGRADSGRKLIDEAARDAAQLPTLNWSGNCRAQTARIVANFDADRALAIIEPFKVQDNNWWHSLAADIAVAIARTHTPRASALLDTVGGPGFDHERAITAIAYQIGRDRPDEAIAIIEGMKRPHFPATIFQAEAFGWLAVALAPRDKGRACALIDRALAMMIDQQNPYRQSASSGGEMAGAAHVAACARRIGYPDMESVIMRVLATHPPRGNGRGASGDAASFVRSVAISAVPLAVLDPAAARTVLEQLEARVPLDPASHWHTSAPWLVAWGLVDLQRAQAVFDAVLRSQDENKSPDLWNSGFFELVELLVAPLTGAKKFSSPTSAVPIGDRARDSDRLAWFRHRGCGEFPSRHCAR